MATRVLQFVPPDTSTAQELHLLRTKLALSQERERQLEEAITHREGVIAMLRPVVAELILDKALRGHMTPVQSQRLAHVAAVLKAQG